MSHGLILFLTLALCFLGSRPSLATNRNFAKGINSDMSTQVPPASGVSQTPQEKLSDVEYEEIRSRVLSRCHLAPDTQASTAPWYFHYELGLELAKHGDAERALDALLQSVERRTDSQRRVRVYGMWFESYIPYFEIARAQAALGRWQCVSDALKLSVRNGEISTEDQEFPEFEGLKLEVEAHHQ